MAWPFARMFGRGRTEQRREGGYFGSLALGNWGAGAPVSAREAEALSAVVACVELICGAIASLPAELMVDTADGRVDAPDTAPAWRILTRPNRQQSWPAFASWLTSQYLLFGNGCAWVQTDARGAVNGLMPLPWPWIIPQVIGGQDGARIVYDVVQSTPDAVLFGLPRRLLDTEVMHVRNRSDYGALGRSVLSRASDPIREGLEIQTVATANWRNGLRPSAVLKAPNYLQDAQRERFNDTWMNKFAGALNAGRVPLLEGGWSMETAAVSSIDAQFAEQRAMSVGEVCRMFSVPEQLIQPGPRAITDMSTYQTLFAQQCLTPIVSAIEAEFDYAVLPAGMHLSLDMGGLMRGSFSASVSALVALAQSGVITSNEAREALGWSEHPEGDGLRIGTPPNFPADFAGGTAMGPKPGPTGNEPALPSHGNQGRQGSNGKMVMQ
jgi:HK97 family phage portal protein